MKNTKVTASDKKTDLFNGDLLVFSLTEVVEGKPVCDPMIEKDIINAFELGDFKGKEGQTLLLYPELKEAAESKESEKQPSARRILAVGLGKPCPGGQEKKDNPKKRCDPDEVREMLRKAGGTVAGVCARIKAKKVVFALPELESFSPADIAEPLAEGVLLGDYRFLKYKKDKEEDPAYTGLSEVKFYSGSSLSSIKKAVKLASAAAQAVYDARDMAHEPGNYWRASEFADYASAVAKKHDLACTIIDKAQMKKLGMGGLIAVNQGSAEPPKMVILEYHPKGVEPKKGGKKSDQEKKGETAGNHETILLVGKGITFDSGGISLKQAAGMEDMKYDMCGGAAVISVMQAVAQEKPENISVIAIVPATDNLSGSAAVKPGDVIRHYNGVTSEIVNTDAEGRMVLADALSYGVELFKPTCVIDIATLTGAVIMGLGHHCSAILGNNDELMKRIEAAAKRASEPVWRLPLTKEYEKQIESRVADIKNTGGKSAGTITAAAYLKNFVGDTPWVHIDIAGTAWDFTEKSYIPKGPAGICVRTFLELIRGWKKLSDTE